MHSTGVIFKRTLYDNRRSIFWWGLGIGLMAIYIVVAYPMVIEGIEGWAEILNSPVFEFVLGDMGDLDITTPEGWFGIEFFSWIPLILAVYAVMFGINITGGEEARGTIDILLTTPTPRWQVIVEKFLAYIACLVLILVITTVSMFAGVAFTPELQGHTSGVLAGMVNILPPMLLIGAMALLLSTLLRSPGRAGGITAAIIVASYFLNSIAGMTDAAVMNTLHYFSFYKYYAPLRIAFDGINWGNFGVLMLISAILFGLSVYFFERRDLYV